MITVYIALGTKRRRREANLLQALRLLPESGVHIRRVSSIYETEPVDYLDQEWFLNAVSKDNRAGCFGFTKRPTRYRSPHGQQKPLQRAPGDRSGYFALWQRND